MPMNSSTSSGDSRLLEVYCYMVKPFSSVFTAYAIIKNLILLPLCILVLYHGLQRWRQQRWSSTASTMTHSESFTYHLVTMELISVFGCIICCCGVYGPGERGREREKVDQSKLRAFYTIEAILGVQLLRFAWNLALAVFYLLNVSTDMLLNSSSPSNDSLQSSFLPFGLDCFFDQPRSSVFITYTAINILLLLPLFSLVLHRGLQQWRQQRSSTAASTSNSDIFTYHMVTMEILNVFGTILGCCSIYGEYSTILIAWYYAFCMNWYGETFFYLLTCLEHYLAVVHPITYLSLRKQRGIRIRNITIGCIWLFCFGATGLEAARIRTLIMDAFLTCSSITIISFCSLSVLCVLIRPGPGERSRDQERVDQSKKRAFYTIMAILGVLLLRCAWNLVWGLSSMLNGDTDKCSWIMGEVLSDLPSSLMLPLLFVHRAGMLACRKNLK
ncbi:hypothetical protein Q8A73_012821 [Channa argus]|nr:hypothetical protein Q8A73_012821 [Channa argus]